MLIPEPVHDAEEVVNPLDPQTGSSAPPSADPVGPSGESGDYALASEPESAAPPEALSDLDENRSPCPMCGEMIMTTAVKCRFCGEVFDASLRGSPLVAGPEAFDPEVVMWFRAEIYGLGGLWIFIGILAVIAGIFVAGARSLPDVVRGLGVYLFLSGCGFIVLGIFTCLKQMWAVYVGLGVSYLFVLVHLVQVSQGACGAVCSIGLLAIGIFLAHRTINDAGKMRAAGIPLTAKV
jgi:hypothetical protein